MALIQIIFLFKIHSCDTCQNIVSKVGIAILKFKRIGPVNVIIYIRLRINLLRV